MKTACSLRGSERTGTGRLFGFEKLNKTETRGSLILGFPQTL
jgi:hypothetical protein